MPYNNIFHKRNNFPEIFIALPETYNGWIQIVRTDSKEQNLQLFIDCNQELCPIYSKSNFYDYPEWVYLFNSIPINFWIAHTYPVKIKDGNIIAVGDGFEWGFKMKKSIFKQIYLLEPVTIFKASKNLDISFFKTQYHNSFSQK